MRLKEGTKIELQRKISQNSFQVVYCRFFAGVLQVFYRLFAGYLQSGSNISTFPVILCHFHSISAVLKRRVTDLQTNGPMDGLSNPLIEVHRLNFRNIGCSSIIGCSSNDSSEGAFATYFAIKKEVFCESPSSFSHSQVLLCFASSPLSAPPPPFLFLFFRCH